MNITERNLLNILLMSHRNPMPLTNRMLKCNDEAGELAEAVNYQEGWLPHKVMKEPLIGEVADVIICALDVLRGSYKDDVTDEELLTSLNEWLVLKGKKWDGILPEAK